MITSRCRYSHATLKRGTKVDGKENHANVNFPPPLIHLVAIMTAVGIDTLFPLALAAHGLSAMLGPVLMVLSALIAGSAFRQFARNDNPVLPNQPVKGLMKGLMDEGAFRFTRNPLYLALGLLHAGIGLISGNGWVLITLLPALLVVRYYVITREEAYLARRFGQNYLDYKARVRRWF